MTGKANTGAQSELLASVWLMAQGFDVFRNVSPDGPVDLIAWRRGSPDKYLIDVKTVNVLYSRQDGHTSINVPKPHPDGIHYLVVSQGVVLGFWRRDPEYSGGIDYNPFG